MAPIWNNYFDHCLDDKTIATTGDEQPKAPRPKGAAKKAKPKAIQ